MEVYLYEKNNNYDINNINNDNIHSQCICNRE